MALSLNSRRINPLIQRVRRHANMTMLFRSAIAAEPQPIQRLLVGRTILGDPAISTETGQPLPATVEEQSGDGTGYLEQQSGETDFIRTQVGSIESVAGETARSTDFTAPPSPSTTQFMGSPNKALPVQRIPQARGISLEQSTAAVLPTTNRGVENSTPPTTASPTQEATVQRQPVAATSAPQFEADKTGTAQPAMPHPAMPHPATDGIDDRTWSRLQNAFHKLKDEPEPVHRAEEKRSNETVQRQTAISPAQQTGMAPLLSAKPTSNTVVAPRRTQIIEAGSLPQAIKQSPYPESPRVQQTVEVADKISEELKSGEEALPQVQSTGVAPPPVPTQPGTRVQLQRSESLPATESNAGDSNLPGGQSSDPSTSQRQEIFPAAGTEIDKIEPLAALNTPNSADATSTQPTALRPIATTNQPIVPPVVNQAITNQAFVQREIGNTQQSTAHLPASDSHVPFVQTDITNFDAKERELADSESLNRSTEDSDNEVGLPLQTVWPVQRLALADDLTSSGESDTQTAFVPLDKPVAPISEAVRQQLEQPQTNRPTESRIDIVMPRRPRPEATSTVAQRDVDEQMVRHQPVEIQQITEASHSGDLQLTSEPNTKKKETRAIESPKKDSIPATETFDSQTVSTSIGSLPADLWTLIGEPIPGSEPNREITKISDSKQQALEKHKQSTTPVVSSNLQRAQAQLARVQPNSKGIESVSDVQAESGVFTSKPVDAEMFIHSNDNRLAQGAMTQAFPVFIPQTGLSPVYTNLPYSGDKTVQRYVQPIPDATMLKPLTVASAIQRHEEQVPTAQMNISSQQSADATLTESNYKPFVSLPEGIGLVSVQHKAATNVQRSPMQMAMPLPAKSSSAIPSSMPGISDVTSTAPAVLRKEDSQITTPGKGLSGAQKSSAERISASIAEIKGMHQVGAATEHDNSLLNPIQRVAEATSAPTTSPQSIPTASAENGAMEGKEGAGNVDIDALANQVYRQLKRKLSIERERLR